MAVRGVSDAARYGTVQLDTLHRVVDFHEKSGAQVAGIVNGGVYVFDRAVLRYIPDGPASLEKDVFPHLLAEGIYGFEQHGLFIDIGTPEDYARAQELCDSLNLAALREPPREHPDR
jgi:NDP-sugar pyrophosphorylase family protein